MRKTALKRLFAGSRPKPLGVALVSLTVSFFLYATVAVFLEFQNAVYDWDLDHEMYFGQALFRGELMWTTEFHDKLPLVQYLFAIPALFDSITAWRVITLLFAVGAASVLIHFSPLLFGQNNPYAKHTGWLAASIYFALFVSAAGSLTHINSVPASSALIALILMVRLFEQKTQQKTLISLGLLIAIFVTVSVSIRPYFLFALIAAAAWLSLRFIRRSPEYTPKTRWGIVLGLALAIVVVGFGANSVPYVVTGRIGAFFEGLRFLLSGLNPYPAYPSFLHQFEQTGSVRVFAWLVVTALAVGVGWALFLRVRGQHGALFVGMVALSSWALALGVLTQHWWPHYANLFSWYVAIIAASVVAWLLRALTTRDGVVAVPASVTAIVVSFLASFAVLITAAGELTGDTPASEHPEAWRLQAISLYLEQHVDEPVSFLSPEHMYAHWKLGEPRHGFPHSANTLHISEGWWEETPVTNTFATPKNSSEYCQMLHNSSIDLVFAEPGASYTRCSRPGDGVGDLVSSEVFVHGGRMLEIWVRAN